MIKNYRLIYLYLFVVIELENIYIIYKNIGKGRIKMLKNLKALCIPLSLILLETAKCFLINL